MRKRLVSLAVLATALVPALAFAGGGAMHPELSAKLSGKSEVPAGAPGGSGRAEIRLSAGKGQVCWELYPKGIGKAMAAHIHKGAPGKAGPIVVPFGGAYKAKGCTKAAKKLIETIETKPNAYYVNIHTAKYPGGAVRGQLVAGMMKK